MPPKRNVSAEDMDEADDDEVMPVMSGVFEYRDGTQHISVKDRRQTIQEKLISKDDDVGDDEEDFFLKGPSSKKTVRFASDKLKDVRVQIAEVTDVMRDNVGRLLERGDQLDNLQDRSEGLATTSDQFRSSATRLRRNMWWQNTRAKLCIGGVVAVILLVIFIPVIIKMNS